MTLTPRQLEIADRLRGGMSNKAIARDLGISVKTVEKHLTEGAARLGIPGRPRQAFVVWFFQFWDGLSES